MRKMWLFLVLLMSMIFPAAVHAQSPTPPPTLTDICFKAGKFQAVDCFSAVWNKWGIGGVVGLIIVILVIYLFLTPGGKVFQEKMEEWIRSWPIFRPAPMPPAEIQRRRADYLLELKNSESLRQPEEIASRFDAYLNRLHSQENPLRPSEDKVFVDLESGLSIDQRIVLSTKSEPNQTKSFVEKGRFNNLTEAIKCLDDQTGYPYPALALLGEPGAGKSTLLRKLARQIVEQCIEDSSDYLPIFVSLSEHESGRPLNFLRQHWKSLLGFDGLDDELAKGKVWLFLDGLNEMPDYQTRKTEWKAFLHQYCTSSGNRALISCRIADYGEGVDLPRLTIHEMDDERIQQFLKKRNPDHADALWNALEKDRDEERGRMYEVAKIPFWLVMISRLSDRDGLPRNRAGLISKFIDRWLDYESGERIGGHIITDDQRKAFLNAMTHLAWMGLSRSQNYVFDMKEARKLLGAKQTVFNADHVVELAQDCSVLSLEPPHKPTKAKFQHQLLQEYFAAYELANRFLAGRNLTKLWKVPWHDWKFVKSEWDPLPAPPPTKWEEAVVLAAGMLSPADAENLALAVVPYNPPLAARCVLESGTKIGDKVTEKVQHRLQQDIENSHVRLPARLAAGKMLAKPKLGDPRLLKRRSEVQLPEGKKISFILPDWADVPAGMSQMGTTAFQARLLKLQHVDVSQDEQPAHLVQVSAFKIARFPVTVLEYRCFIEAGGYENDAYWKEGNSLRWRDAPLPYEESYEFQLFRELRENPEALLRQVDIWVRQGSWSPAQAESLRIRLKDEDDVSRKRWEEYEADKRNTSGKAARPWLWDNQQYTLDNQPVIGVTWYEACAYAAWLTEMLRMQGTISEQEEIRLPTEAEWEKAARGNRGRLWSWGNIWRSSFANSLEGRVMQPSTIGAYPQNKSPYGALDMIGNVWEWCSDWYAEDTYGQRSGEAVKDPPGPASGSARVLRGGSWDYDRSLTRGAYRYRYYPGNFSDSLGFRFVLSPDIGS